MKQYDYLIVGAGLFGAVFAHEATRRGKRCLVVERRDHIGGNCYTESVQGINVHKYGAHIFHTSNRRVWDYVNSFVEFNNFVNSPIANYHGELYNLPFNMNTFHQLWPDVVTPADARRRVEEQRAEYAYITEPKNLEEQALVLGGRDVYEKLVKEYSEKQWGMKATDIPAFVIRRLPFRFTYDNNYFNDKYQGIPEGGYTLLFERLLEGVEVRLNVDFLVERESLMPLAEQVVYTGPIDAWFDYRLGHLEYRTVTFETTLLENVADYQGNAVFNYTSHAEPYTRIIEHKHFEFGKQPCTVISKEYSKEWESGDEPYYPINNQRNEALAESYRALAEQEQNVIFGGRLAEYRYYDMDKVIERALNCFE